MFKGQVCSNCVMDESDPEISFDEKGVCIHCNNFEKESKLSWFPNDIGRLKLSKILNLIKSENINNEYDCILGLSGGVDSSYLVLKAKEWGLRPLLLHVDAGWNSELAVANIEAVAKHTGYDLFTHVVKWSDMRQLQLAYLKSGVSNQDVPQDHIFFSTLYGYAAKNNIQYVLNGGNLATEGIFPRSWLGPAMDAINLKDIYKKHGDKPLKEYKTVSFFQYYIDYPLLKKMKVVRPLNYIDFNKNKAIDELMKVGWQPYERKHGESIFTKFYQNYYLPNKFGFDKRKPHLSSLIVSGQLTREKALRELEKPLYDSQELIQDIDYFCKKMKISKSQFDSLMEVPNKSYLEFDNWNNRYKFFKIIQLGMDKILRKKLKFYS